MKHLRGIIHCIALWHIRTLILSEIKLNILWYLQDTQLKTLRPEKESAETFIESGKRRIHLNESSTFRWRNTSTSGWFPWEDELWRKSNTFAPYAWTRNDYLGWELWQFWDKKWHSSRQNPEKRDKINGAVSQKHEKLSQLHKYRLSDELRQGCQ